MRRCIAARASGTLQGRGTHYSAIYKTPDRGAVLCCWQTPVHKNKQQGLSRHENRQQGLSHGQGLRSCSPTKKEEGLMHAHARRHSCTGCTSLQKARRCITTAHRQKPCCGGAKAREPPNLAAKLMTEQRRISKNFQSRSRTDGAGDEEGRACAGERARTGAVSGRPLRPSCPCLEGGEAASTSLKRIRCPGGRR